MNSPEVVAMRQGYAQPKLQSAAMFVKDYVAPEYCIDGLLLRRRVYSLTGDTGHGKTAVALTLAVHKALGRDLDGRRIEPGRVVYLAGENPDDVQARVILMAARMGINVPELPIYFVRGSFNLAAGLDALAAAVRTIEGADLAIVDTGAAFLAAGGGDEENNNMDAYRFASELRKLTTLPGEPTALALMHPVKRATRDNLLPRGGGAFLNEMDGNLTVWAEGERKTTELSWQGKLRGPTFDPITFELETDTCAGLVDAKGRQIPSVWAFPTTAQRAEQAMAAQTDDEDALLMAMANHPGKSLAALAALLAIPKSRVQRVMARLAAHQLVRKVRGGRYALTKAGKDDAKDAESKIRREAE
jgi:hypothetical protein